VEIGAATQGPLRRDATGQIVDLYPQLRSATSTRGPGRLAALTLQWDGRDNRLFPTRGFFAQFSTEVADEYLGSANTYVGTTSRRASTTRHRERLPRAARGA
jgi:outer membrane protein assembly factor BamA